MGSQPEEVDQVRMMKFFCLLATLAVVKSSGPEDFIRMVKRNVSKYLFDSECWGRENMDKFYSYYLKSSEKCFQMEPTIDVVSKLRPERTNPFSPLPQPLNNPFQKPINGGYLESDEDDILEFLEDFKTFGHNVATSIS